MGKILKASAWCGIGYKCPIRGDVDVFIFHSLLGKQEYLVSREIKPYRKRAEMAERAFNKWVEAKL